MEFYPFAITYDGMLYFTNVEPCKSLKNALQLIKNIEKDILVSWVNFHDENGNNTTLCLRCYVGNFEEYGEMK